MSLLDELLSTVSGVGAPPVSPIDSDLGFLNFGDTFAGGAQAADSLFGDIPAIQGGAPIGQFNNAPDPGPAQQQVAQANPETEAAKPPLNWQQRQQENRQLINGHQASTSRYYTRQLYRAMAQSRDPEARIQGRLGSRIQGAPDNSADYVSNRVTMSTGPDDPGSPSGTDWDATFNSTRSNRFKDSPGVFNQRTGKMDPVPIQRQIADTQEILDSVARMTAKTNAQLPKYL